MLLRSGATAGKPAAATAPASRFDRQAKLTALFKHLEEKRKNTNVKNQAALAAFNQEAAEYSRQVTEFNAASSATASAR